MNEKIDLAVAGILKAMETQVAVAKAELDSLVESVEKARLARRQETDREPPYFDKKKDLDDLEDMRRLLKRKMDVTDIDLNLPKTAQVIIVEHGVSRA